MRGLDTVETPPPYSKRSNGKPCYAFLLHERRTFLPTLLCQKLWFFHPHAPSLLLPLCMFDTRNIKQAFVRLQQRKDRTKSVSING